MKQRWQRLPIENQCKGRYNRKMRFHDITDCDMVNGDGLRAVLWVSGCEMRCKNCQNPITWNPDCGVVWDEKSKEELFSYLSKDYISGLTLSGGHPLMECNLKDIYELVCEVNEKFPNKNIWLYTGYRLEDLIKSIYTSNYETDILRMKILDKIDILVDGRYIEELLDNNYQWAGSTNQRVIDIKETMKQLRDNIDENSSYDEIEKDISKYIIIHKSTI